ncbi:hypothetical protein PHLGIDRAFT_331760 [Phlebiopsis gigantea 11061_1 CR5-6]|uniref:Uncharacterized protein n=1 Tax=Phlebiopsis gigantea (strain 11061_1 CR5-6) TaxID=745531 RepID=A0A0C3PWI8_PHLG1|nr:hypothetical protein PHLGIDRAFT_331760 [Phlebiopsis gigantea 11061_1 CR5-6]
MLPHETFQHYVSCQKGAMQTAQSRLRSLIALHSIFARSPGSSIYASHNCWRFPPTQTSIPQNPGITLTRERPLPLECKSKKLDSARAACDHVSLPTLLLRLRYGWRSEGASCAGTLGPCPPGTCARHLRAPRSAGYIAGICFCPSVVGEIIPGA